MECVFILITHSCENNVINTYDKCKNILCRVCVCQSAVMTHDFRRVLVLQRSLWLKHRLYK